MVTGVLGSEGAGMREDPVPISPCSPLLEGCSTGRLPIQSLPPVAVLLFRTKLTIRILEHKSWFRMVLCLAGFQAPVHPDRAPRPPAGTA